MVDNGQAFSESDKPFRLTHQLTQSFLVALFAFRGILLQTKLGNLVIRFRWRFLDERGKTFNKASTLNLR